MKRLKLKDSVDLEEIASKYNMEYDSDSDYESGYSYAIYIKDGVVFDVSNCTEDFEQGTIYIEGIDSTELDLLYDLIKADLVEKVEK